MNLVKKKAITWEAGLRKLIRHIPITARVKLKWTKALVEYEYTKEIVELRKQGDRDAQQSKEHDRHWELNLLNESEEGLYTKQLINRARRLRVHVPPMPQWGENYEQANDENWVLGDIEAWLTTKGIALVREEIRKEEKWRQEKRSHWIQFGVSLIGIIGALTGLVAVFLK